MPSRYALPFVISFDAASVLAGVMLLTLPAWSFGPNFDVHSSARTVSARAIAIVANAIHANRVETLMLFSPAVGRRESTGRARTARAHTHHRARAAAAASGILAPDSVGPALEQALAQLGKHLATGT